MDAIDGVAQALEAVVELQLRWRGEQLDRLLDAHHAALQDTVARMLNADGWEVRAEVSFNYYGDRGRVDLLAFHPTTRTLLVIEIKSGVGDVQETLGRLDVKVRLGPLLARQAGWPAPTVVVPALVIGDSRASRRIVAGHPALFASFTLRGRWAQAWVKQPNGTPTGMLWFAKRPDSHVVVRRG